MAFTVTARAQAQTGFSPVATVTTSSFTPSANSLLLGFGHSAGNQSSGMNEALPASPFTGTGGLTWTEEQSFEGLAAPEFGIGGTGFRLNSVFMWAAVGGSPASQTVTYDGFATSLDGFYCVALVDVTGHDTGAPIVQSAEAEESKSGGDTEFFGFEFSELPALGNLVVVSYGANADSGGAFDAPTYGSQAMVEVYNHTGGVVHNGVWYRIIDGSELGQDFMCTDLGDAVGSVTVFAVEIALAPAAPPPNVTLPIVQSGLRLA
jgi:hypothetical protein